MLKFLHISYEIQLIMRYNYSKLLTSNEPGKRVIEQREQSMPDLINKNPLLTFISNQRGV